MVKTKTKTTITIKTRKNISKLKLLCISLAELCAIWIEFKNSVSSSWENNK